MTSVNMLLPIPSPLVTISPLWAEEISQALELIDEHDHSTGKGVLVTPLGLNINADLNIQNNDLYNVRTTRYQALLATPSAIDDLRIVYVKNNELCYRDAAGQEVQITNNGAVNISAGTGTIAGLVAPASATFSTLLGTFIWLKDTDKPAKMVVSDLAISEFDVASAPAVTIKSPAALASPYSILLPPTLVSPGEPPGLLTIDEFGNSSVTTFAPFYWQQRRLVEYNDGTTGSSQDKIIYSGPINLTFNNTSPSSDFCPLKYDLVDGNRWIKLKLETDPDKPSSADTATALVLGGSNLGFFDLEYSLNGGAWTSYDYFVQQQNGANVSPITSREIFFNIGASGEYRFRLRPFANVASNITVQHTVLIAQVL